MGLIINKSIPKFICGYPTVSDKYNVMPGILKGSTEVQFGDLVKYGDTTGCYEAIGATDISASNADATIAGVVVATNVQLNTQWPEGGIKVEVGTAFNLLHNGFIAVKLETGAVESEIVPNGAVHVTAAGKFTTPTGTGHISALAGYTFTGETELQNGVRYAEIYVK